MVTTSRYLEAPQRLRAFVRAHETSLVILAALIGIVGGVVVVAMSVAVAGLHAVLFDISIRERLSSQISIDPWRALLVPTLGGLLLGLGFLVLARFRPAREIDPIEANALHGGRYRRSGPQASAPRSGSRPATPSWPAVWPPRSGVRFICAAPTSESWSAAARRPRSPARSGRPWPAPSTPSS
jgi:hypothetical protein